MHIFFCHRARTQVNQHLSLVRSLSRTFVRLSIRLKLERGLPVNVGRDSRVGMVIERGSHRPRRQRIATNSYSLTSRTRTLTQGFVYVQESLIEKCQLLPHLMRGSATTALVRDMCPWSRGKLQTRT